MLGSLGLLWFGAGDPARAEGLYREALGARRALGDRRMIGNTLNSLGTTNYLLGRYEAAVGFLSEARRVREQAGEVAPLGSTLNFLALSSSALGRNDSTEAWYRRSLELTTAAGDSARINLAYAADSEHDFDEADRLGAEALGIAVAAADSERVALACQTLGRVAYRRGDMGRALAFDRRAALLIDTLRSRQGSEATRISLFGSQLFAYEALIHLLGKLDATHPDSGFADEAFQWAERARARALLDAVAGARAGSGASRQRVTPVSLAGARALLADDRTALLEYSLGDTSSSLWVVTRRGETRITLPPRSAFQPRAEVLRRSLGDPRFGDGPPRLAPLPSTAAEVAALGSLAGGRNVVAVTGREAVRERLLSASKSGPLAVLHVATHGVADESEPARSGLWCAAPADSAPPGFVSLGDIAEMGLRADLVTLSACETGVGRLERGEGVMGLTRAFLVSGAQSVIVSLWPVNDRSTAALMESFYRSLLAHGRPRDEALAEARLALMRNRETRSPFYWAPFVLVGAAGALK